ncbi:uncharacterized protein BO97DRAFT_429808 [Aspergillus homomorphus CBS 101889]|uniref:Squalene cyclase C-terminal domain-containing protein n=1 Tax=Aspergillus homomorphus (strain CBS 101889) TaxID=1450537 RepID=A0A395HGL9_ASPHC|nr:hypothetical protein BO97DRAFT_429808 [Aspergillus homomorphus CBS 101889]RAL06900.1 hypothetical protein BO97DRAFT_429808 [Aspergillus homomorphus CBS 101889]
MHLGSLAMILEGFGLTNPPVVKRLEGVERFAYEDRHGCRMQVCAPGGYSFGYLNSWCPDVDNTTPTIIAFLKHVSYLNCHSITHAIIWILGVQNRGGRWGAVDIDNNALSLNKIR